MENSSTAKPSTSNRNSKPMAEWQDIHKVERGNVVLTVSMLPIKPRAKYSIRFGWKTPNDRIIVNLPMVIEGRGTVSVTGPSMKDLNDCQEEATEWLSKHAQEQEDVWIAERQDREKRQLDREKPKPSVGIKSLGKLDAMKKELSGKHEDSEAVTAE